MSDKNLLYMDKMIDTDDEQLDVEEKSYDFTRDGDTGNQSNDLWSEEVKAWADMLTIESLFYTEDWVYICTDLMAQKISSQPLYVMKKTFTDGVETVDYADTHPLNALVQNPNPMQDYHSWMYSTVVNMGLLGNAVIWNSAANNWLVTLRTALVDIQFNPDGAIRAYGYSGSGDTIAKESSKTYYDPKTIIHARRPNPASLLWGLSPFVPGRKSILFNRYSSDYLNSFYLKQATPGMIIEMDKQVNEQQALRQLRSFELAYTGRKNQRRTMILPKGMKASPVSHTISDQKLTDLINMNRETIVSLLKIPKHEVGLQTGGSLGSEEYKLALRNFWESTLIPTCRMIEGALNKYFKARLGDQYFFQFDLSGVESLKDDQMKKATMAKEMLAAGLSVNEVRTRVWEVEASANAADDIPFVSIPKAAPAAFALPPPIATTKPTENIEIIEEEGKAIVVTSGTQKIKDLVAKRKQGWVENYVKGVEDLVDKNQGKKIEALALEILVSLAEVAEPIIKRNLVDVKAADVPSKTKLKRELSQAFGKFEEEWVTEYIKSLSSVVDLGYDQQLEFVFNEADKDKIQALRDKGKKGVRMILEERGLESFSNVSKTHTDRIMSAIVDGVKEGEAIGQIIKRVAETFADPAAMAAKASTIARTETLTAMSIGQGAALKNAATVIPGLKKAWLNADDSRVRDAHLDESQGGVSGQVVDANDTFSNGLRWPRDTGSEEAGEVINCRCTLITLPPGEDLNV